MKAKRRLGAETAKNRGLLVEAAGQLMVEEGYAAVTARKVANRAGLKVPLVYYYFRTMDDLITEVVWKNQAERMEKFVSALGDPDPLRAIWKLNRESTSAVMTTELLALANHRENIRAEIVTAAREFRALQIEVVDRLLTEQGINTAEFPAAGIVTIVAALGRAMAQDCALNNGDGYKEAVFLVEKSLEGLSKNKPSAERSSSTQAM